MNNISDSEPFIICREFPLLLHNEDHSVWDGHLSFDDNQFKIKMCVPYYPSMTDACFECSPSVTTCLRSQITNLKKCKTLLSLIYCIVHTVKTKLSTDLLNNNSMKHSHLILKELEKSLPKENIVEIQDNFLNIKLKYVDQDAEEHFLYFAVSSEYPKGNIEILGVDLPSEVLGTLLKVNTICDLYVLFKRSVDSLNPFWNVCRSLDEKAWVVDPLIPRKRDVFRRILISEHLSIVITFNPIDMSSYPDIKFLGSVKAVTEAREVYLRNLGAFGWMENLDVTENIAHLFSIEKLPTKTSADKIIDDDKECFICFTLSSENEELPSKWCNNTKCSSWYHHSCLVQWLLMVVSGTEINDHVSGACPYCGEKLWCRISKCENEKA